LNDKNLLIGFKNNDDAAVYKIDSKKSIVFTVDFFTPIVDDPVHYGRISACNSISDVYAMGGKPFLALNVIGFPSNDLENKVLNQILKGAFEITNKAGVVIGGGHTVKDNELKFGLAVLGFVDNKNIIHNSNAEPGDIIILTKPIGTGIITTAQKNTGKIQARIINPVIKSMEHLNNKVCDIMLKYRVKCATDITGFGLLGHLSEIAKASNVDIAIDSESVPVFDGTITLAKKGFISGGTYANHEFLAPIVTYDKSVSELKQLILCDAQTSGGIVMFCKPKDVKKIQSELSKTELANSIIGHVITNGNGILNVD